MINASVRGNVGNVDLKYLPDGKPVLEFSLASNDRGKGGVEVTTWVRCAVFGPRAEALAKVIDKGASLMAESAHLAEVNNPSFRARLKQRTSLDVIDDVPEAGPSR